MLYELTSEKQEGQRTVRTYKNNKTGSQTKLSLIYTDKDGGKWWAFMDLYSIPIMRVSMAKNITDMYTIGLSLKDIQSWCADLKKELKGSDPEKYEKTYAKLLEMENIATFTADPIKQQLALCTVYILADDELIDYFDETQSFNKMNYWKGNNEMVAFFLTWHTKAIQPYIKRLDRISTIASKMQEQVQAMQEDPTAFVKP